MRKKLKNRLGFSLTETLIAVALLALVSAAGAVVSGVVISVRNNMIQTADSRILASTILETMADEVRFGNGFVTEADGTTINSFNSMKFGEGTTFKIMDADDVDNAVTAAGKVVEDGGGTADQKDEAETNAKAEAEKHVGHILVKTGTGTTYYLLAEKAYSHLVVSKFTMVENTADGSITISLAIKNSANKELWTGDLTVTPLNG